jgi:hypothetical protein
METIFNAFRSELWKLLPLHLKAPLPIALERSAGLLNDLQNQEAIVFCDQVQVMQVTRDPLAATEFMVNAMNTGEALSDLLRQDDIPRLLNKELKNRKPAHKAGDGRPTVDPSSSVKIEPRPARDPPTAAYDPNAYDPNYRSSRGKKRKEEGNDTPSPSLVLAHSLCPMLNGDVLHPFSPQYHLWDGLWLEQDQGAQLRDLPLVCYSTSSPRLTKQILRRCAPSS